MSLPEYDLERASTIASPGAHAVRLTTRETNLHLPPDKPLIPVDSNSRERVIKLVSGYIRKQKEDGHTKWAKHISYYLEKFEKMPNSVRLNSFLSITDYFSEVVSDSDCDLGIPVSGIQARSEVQEIVTYADFFKYLGTPRGSNLKAQIISFVHGNEVVDRLKSSDKWLSADRAAIAMSFPAREGSHVSSEKLFRVTATMLCAILGAYWNIDSVNLARLFGIACDVAKAERKCRIRLPSCGVPKPPSSQALFQGLSPAELTAPEKLTQVHSEQISILESPMFFQSDNHVYAKRPHSRPPSTNPMSVYLSSDNEWKSYRVVASCFFPCEVEQKPIDLRDLSNLSDQGSVDSIALSPRFALGALERKCLRTHCQMLNEFSDSLEKLKYLSRPYPSIAKLEWLLHATDCVETMKASTLSMGQYPISWPCKSSELWDDWSKKFEEDKKAVWTGAGELVEEIAHIRKIIRQTMEISSGSRSTLLAVLAAIYVPLSFTTGIFGMNTSEINNSIPKYWHVLVVGLPLAALTALLPLYYNSLWRFSYTTLPSLQRALQTSSSDRILTAINLVFAAITLALCGTSYYFKWGPIIGFVVWAVFASFVCLIRRARVFWSHWFLCMLVLLMLLLLVFAKAVVWSFVPVLIYWVLRDFPSFKALAAVLRRVREVRP